MKGLLTLLMLSVMSFPAMAQVEETALDQDQISAPEIKRWAIEAGGGGLLAFVHGRVVYRTPWLDNKLAFYADYAPLEAETDVWPGRFHTAMVGARYYTDPLSDTTLFFTAGIGTSFNPAGAAHPTEPNRNSGIFPTVFPHLGVGLDYMFLPNWGINAQIGMLYLVPRGDLNLKFVF